MATADLIKLYLAHLRERGCTQATIETYLDNLTRADRSLQYGLDTANTAELRAWLWRDGLAPATRAAYHAAVSGFFRWAVETGELDFDPATKIPRPKVPLGRPRVANDGHVRWAICEAPEPYRLFATLAAYGGLRCIEVSRLHREHVDAHITQLHRGKGDKPRIVPTHPVIWSAVEPLPGGPITDLSARTMSCRFTQLAIRNGQRGLSMHRLRGWFATRGYKATKDILALQRNMGHVNPGTSARYIELADEQLKAVIDGLPTFGWDGAAQIPEPPSFPR